MEIVEVSVENHDELYSKLEQAKTRDFTQSPRELDGLILLVKGRLKENFLSEKDKFHFTNFLKILEGLKTDLSSTNFLGGSTI